MAVGHVNALDYMQDITVLVDLSIFLGSCIYLPLLEPPMERQLVPHIYKLNASMGTIMVHKVSGHRRYFHASTNNYRLLTLPAYIWDI